MGTEGVRGRNGTGRWKRRASLPLEALALDTENRLDFQMSGRDRGGKFGGRPGQPAVSEGFLRKGLGKPRASAAKAEVPSSGLTEPSRGQGYGLTRAGSPQGPPRGAFWAEVEVGPSRWSQGLAITRR